PNEIIEIDFVEGRHRAQPTGNVLTPPRDEVLLLHYKYLGFARTHARQRQLRAGLGPRDLKRDWGAEYAWSEDELRKDWHSVAAQAVNIREVTADDYPTERRWRGWTRAAEPYGA